MACQMGWRLPDPMQFCRAVATSGDRRVLIQMILEMLVAGWSDNCIPYATEGYSEQEIFALRQGHVPVATAQSAAHS